MSQLEDNNFVSEWQDLAALRQLATEAGQRQQDPNVSNIFKDSTNNEFEVIKGCGQVTFHRLYFHNYFITQIFE